MATSLDQQTIAGRVRLIRATAGLTQQEFADLLGVHKNTVGKWERGETAPDLAVTSRICGNLGISPSWLVTGKGKMQHRQLLDASVEGLRSVQTESDNRPDMSPHARERFNNGSSKELITMAACMLMAGDNTLNVEDAVSDALDIYQAVLNAVQGAKDEPN